jgi:outer membrane protein OmpA-like peptidoglycan-associated protein
MRFYLWIAAFILSSAAGFAEGADSPPGPDGQALYAEAQRLFERGDFRRALPLFVEAQSSLGRYRRTNLYIQECVQALREGRERDELSGAVQRAEAMVERRRALFQEIARRPDLVSRDDGAQTVFSIPAEAFFEPEKTSLRRESARLLDLMKSYLATYHRPAMAVVCECGESAGADERRRALRREGIVADFFLRQSGLPPERILIRSAPGRRESYRFVIASLPPPPGKGEDSVQGVLVNAGGRSLDLKDGRPLPLEVTLFEPVLIKAWTLDVFNAEGGRVRRFTGPPELFSSLEWDGRDEQGAPVLPGEYQTFLNAQGWNAQTFTDSEGLVVTDSRAPAAPKPEESPLPPVEQHMILVRFDRNASALSERSLRDVERAAVSLRINPGKNVCVEGYAEAGEDDALRLAEARASALRDELVHRWGIPPERIQTRGRRPRAAVAGETLKKAVLFFVE